MRYLTPILFALCMGCAQKPAPIDESRLQLMEYRFAYIADQANLSFSIGAPSQSRDGKTFILLGIIETSTDVVYLLSVETNFSIKVVIAKFDEERVYAGDYDNIAETIDDKKIVRITCKYTIDCMVVLQDNFPAVLEDFAS